MLSTETELLAHFFVSRLILKHTQAYTSTFSSHRH